MTSVPTVFCANEFPSFVVGKTPSSSSDATTTTLSLVHIDAPAMSEREDSVERRKAVRISAVMDISGSMAGQKLRLAIESLCFMVDELSDRDEFGVVSFESEVEEVFPVSKMDAEGKEAAKAAVKALSDRGCTRLSHGLFAGIQQVHKCDLSKILGDRTEGDSIPFMMQQVANANVNVMPQMQMRQQQQIPMDLNDDNECAAEEEEAQQQQQEEEEMCQQVQVQQQQQQQLFLPPQMRGAATAPPSDDSVDEVIKRLFPEPDFEALKKDNAFAKSVILFTDGEANEGITSPPLLVAAVKQLLEIYRDDFNIFAFGFGSDHNAELLRELSVAAQGSYAFIEGTETMKEAFANCLGGLVSVVMTNLQLRISSTSSAEVEGAGMRVKLNKVWTRYPVTTDQSGDGAANVSTTTTIITMKNLFSEEQRDLLVLMDVTIVDPKAAAAMDGRTLPLFTARLVFDNALTLKHGEEVCVDHGIPVVVSSETAGQEERVPDTRVDEQRNRLEALDVMEAARKHADSGDVAAAKQELTSMKSRITNKKDGTKKSAPLSAFNAALVQQLTTAERCYASEDTYRSTGGKKMAQMYTAHAQQRCNDVSEEASYATAHMSKMRSKCKK